MEVGLDRAGFTPAAVAADEASADDSDMSSWSIERLRAFVAEGERELAREGCDGRRLRVLRSRPMARASNSPVEGAMPDSAATKGLLPETRRRAPAHRPRERAWRTPAPAHFPSSPLPER